MTKPLALIWDLDGTLSDSRHRIKLIEGKHKDFDRFHALGVLDPPHKGLIRLAQEASKKMTIIVLTGRPDQYRKDALQWLYDNGLSNAILLMKPEKERSKPAAQFKKEAYENLIAPKYHIVAAFDDEQKNLNMWQQSLGIPAYLCANGKIIKKS